MHSLLRPRSVPRGGTIGLAAPAGPVDPERLACGETQLREGGFDVVRGEDITARRGYLAGDDERRAREVMDFIRDPAIDAIVCVRGGYGCQRIVDQLDASAVRRAAKPLVGYSDITTLLLWQVRAAGLVGVHGPMLEREGGFDSVALEILCQALLGEDDGRVLPGRGLGEGAVEGPLCGGSLSMVVSSLGTPFEIQTQGRILLLEEVNEAPYRIDRMLQQMSAAGKFDGVLGIGVGGLVDCGKSSEDPSAKSVVSELLCPLEIPLVVDLPFGHMGENHAWPLGGKARLDGGRGDVMLLEASTVTRSDSIEGDTV